MDVHHNKCEAGISHFKCDFYGYGQITLSGEWFVIAYPIIHFYHGFFIRHFTITVTSKSNSSSTRVYHTHGVDLTPLTVSRVDNVNGTFTHIMTFSAPWRTTKGSVTADVTLESRRYRKTFIFHRHSVDFYVTFTVLMVLSALVLAAYILRRTKRRSESTVYYTNDLE